jgi:molybdenum cofactor cytidylyltransferase
MIKTECIILAAGYSSRANTNKMLLKLGNKTVIECCIDTFYDSCSGIVVVGGYRIEDIKPVLTKYKKLRLVYNAYYPEGMFSSVKEGLSHITGDQFFITPGDYPMLQKATIHKLLSRDDPVIIPVYKGICGHPVRMKSNLIPEILSGGYGSLHEFVTSKNPFLMKVNDIGVVSDIDYMEDYHRILNLLHDSDMEVE